MAVYESLNMLHMLAPVYFGFIAFAGVTAEEVWGTKGTINQSEIGFTKKKRRIIRWIAMILMAPILFICLRVAFPKLMDIPGIMAGEYRSMEGTVKECFYDYGEGGPNIAGALNVEDISGKLYQFSNIHVPRFLEIGDRVKVDYRKFGKSGVIREINQKEFEAFGGRPFGLFIFIMVYPLLSMPLYFLYIFKWRPYLDRKKNYSICVYHDDLVRNIGRVGIIRLQSIVAMFIAMMGFSGIVMDIYWGLLVSGNYIGIVCLSFLRHKRFVLIKDKFYYRNFRQEIEGSIEEIEFVERRKGGVVIGTKEEEMEIRCTKEKYVEELMKKIGKEEEKNDGE